MNNEMTTEALALYNAADPESWNRISELRIKADLTWEQAGAAAQWWLENTSDVEVEPEVFGWRISEDERLYAPVIGGEARHLIRFA